MRTSVKFLPALCALALALPASAQGDGRDRDRDHERGREHEGERAQIRGDHWRGDIRRFHEHDLDRWHGGHWFHGRNGDRLGWWWIVGPSWYFYNAPIYPAPDPYLPPQMAGNAPPAEVGAPRFWYFCASPRGYYPYIAQCNVRWQQVSARP